MIQRYLSVKKDLQVFLEKTGENRTFIFNFPLALFSYRNIILADIVKCWPELLPMVEKKELKENKFLVLKSEHGTLILFSIISDIEKEKERIYFFKRAFYESYPFFRKGRNFVELSSFNSFSNGIKFNFLDFLAKSKKKFTIFIWL